MNQADFKAFYINCWKYCKPRLRQYIDNQADIEDVFSEAISRFWVNIQSEKVSHADNHFGLVYVMAKNIWLGQIRKEKNRYMVSIHTSNDDDSKGIQISDDEQNFLEKIIAETEQKETEQDIQKAWGQLDGKCQDILTASIVYKEPQEKMIERLGIKNTDTAKATKYRCLQYLKKYYYQLAA
jgi:RNA polymerase sigma factor (sigma-70 family)